MAKSKTEIETIIGAAKSSRVAPRFGNNVIWSNHLMIGITIVRPNVIDSATIDVLVLNAFRENSRNIALMRRAGMAKSKIKVINASMMSLIEED